MKNIDQTLAANGNSDVLAAKLVRRNSKQHPLHAALASLGTHWPEYFMEAALLGIFMISACLFTVLFEYPHSPPRRMIDSALLRRVFEGVAMGVTAVGIIYSPWGKQSGAHINPSVTLTFLRLRKIKFWDAVFYIMAQFIGAALAVYMVAIFLGPPVSDPAVRYVVTVPGPQGPWFALFAEFTISGVLMAAILYASNHHGLSSYTGIIAGILVAAYIILEAPASGMSMNPARTFGSALPAGVWDAWALYFTAPPLGMMTAAEGYLWWSGKQIVKCCKLHHDNSKRCIFCGANGGFAS
jgi:aquaporin Z